MIWQVALIFDLVPCSFGIFAWDANPMAARRFRNLDARQKPFIKSPECLPEYNRYRSTRRL
jgi:hypothetical protein